MAKLSVKCSKCKKTHDISCDDFAWEEVERNPRNMGQEIRYSAEFAFDCDCGQEIQITLDCWEYPEGVYNHSEQEAEGAEIIANECPECP